MLKLLIYLSHFLFLNFEVYASINQSSKSNNLVKRHFQASYRNGGFLDWLRPLIIYLMGKGSC